MSLLIFKPSSADSSFIEGLDVANETLRRLFSRTRLRLARLGGFLGSHRGVPRRLNGVMGILSITIAFRAF